MPAPSVSPQAGLIRRLAAWRLPLGIALVLLAFALIEPRGRSYTVPNSAVAVAVADVFGISIGRTLSP